MKPLAIKISIRAWFNIISVRRASSAEITVWVTICSAMFMFSKGCYLLQEKGLRIVVIPDE
jgi:hypothetical protein